jgi:hypothetical protein
MKTDSEMLLSRFVPIKSEQGVFFSVVFLPTCRQGVAAYLFKRLRTIAEC